MRGWTTNSLVMIGMALFLAAWAAPAHAAQARRPAAAKPAAADSGKRLRTEWKLSELKLQREAVDDATFAPDIKKSAIAAVDLFVQQQEGLIAQAEKSPQAEAKVRQTRQQLETQFKQKMSAIYDNPKLMAELGKRMKALEKEMEELSDSADKAFARLDTLNLTPEQAARIRPVVKDANARLKQAVAKAPSKSPKDQAVREDAVKEYRTARAKVRQALTPQQRAKLAQKLAEEQ